MKELHTSSRKVASAKSNCTPMNESHGPSIKKNVRFGNKIGIPTILGQKPRHPETKSDKVLALS